MFGEFGVLRVCTHQVSKKQNPRETPSLGIKNGNQLLRSTLYYGDFALPSRSLSSHHLAPAFLGGTGAIVFRRLDEGDPDIFGMGALMLGRRREIASAPAHALAFLDPDSASVPLYFPFPFPLPLASVVRAESAAAAAAAADAEDCTRGVASSFRSCLLAMRLRGRNLKESTIFSFSVGAAISVVRSLASAVAAAEEEDEDEEEGEDEDEGRE